MADEPDVESEEAESGAPNEATGPSDSEAIETPDTPDNQEDNPLAALQAEVESLKDQVLRSQAEMENLRRRSARDVENAHKFGVEKLLGDLLPALDSYEKGIEEAGKLEGEAGGAVAQGLDLAQKLFLETLAKYGLTTEFPHGEPFDPQKHEAVAMVPNPDMEPNSVMEVLQRGYMLHDRVVRAAKVVVSRSADG